VLVLIEVEEEVELVEEEVEEVLVDVVEVLEELVEVEVPTKLAHH